MLKKKKRELRETAACLKSHCSWLVAKAGFEFAPFRHQSLLGQVAFGNSGPRLQLESPYCQGVWNNISVKRKPGYLEGPSAKLWQVRPSPQVSSPYYFITVRRPQNPDFRISRLLDSHGSIPSPLSFFSCFHPTQIASCWAANNPELPWCFSHISRNDVRPARLMFIFSLADEIFKPCW